VPLLVGVVPSSVEMVVVLSEVELKEVLLPWAMTSEAEAVAKATNNPDVKRMVAARVNILVASDYKEQVYKYVTKDLLFEKEG
jgi:bifunctional DNase/RNase